mmetsp:Transcript_16450/g.35624  ORF Transcript_16450/g.35624 Transcript_16450/m.35624 type:complete len:146 (+) Transcript_16450:1699-2136(+)
MGLLRDQRAHEILSQVWLALRLVRLGGMAPLVNVVFMGMGEPLNNLREVSAAVGVLCHPEALPSPAATSASPQAAPRPLSSPPPPLLCRAASRGRCTRLVTCFARRSCPPQHTRCVCFVMHSSSRSTASQRVSVAWLWRLRSWRA